MYKILALLAEIEAKRAAMKPEDRAALEAAERIALRESFIRALGPCEHGNYDWEICQECMQAFADAKASPQPPATDEAGAAMGDLM